MAHNCLDRHVDASHGQQVAYHWEGEPGDTRTITYAERHADVQRTNRTHRFDTRPPHRLGILPRSRGCCTAGA